MSTKEFQMSERAVLNIPPELMKFVNRDTYSLLIKGHAGTGKTTLALTILKILNIRENFQYISTRVSPTQMHHYYPWLANHFKSTKHSQTLDEENEIEAPIFVDARLDEPSSMFERITNQLMDIGSPMIIIDTWDAISYFMDKEAVMNNARVLQTWCERAKAKMIFISDNPQDTTFDVLVDGIVELGQRYYDDRLLRKITISKMRGTKINRPSYKFTLNNGSFRSIEPYNPSDFTAFLVQKTQKSEPPLVGNLIKSGNKDLDEAIGGGFPVKSIASINLGPSVNWKIAIALLTQMFSNFLAFGSPILFKGSQTEANYIASRMKNVSGNPKTSPSIVFVGQNQDSKAKTGSLAATLKKLRTKNPNKPILGVVFSDATHKISVRDLDDLKELGDLTIIVNSNSQENTLNGLSKYIDVSVSLQEINGTLFLRSDVPWSHLYAVIMDKAKDNQYVRLEPIV